MRSRMDRYNNLEDRPVEQSRRSNKNQELYRNIGTNTKYTNFTDVTNSNAIEIDNAKKNYRTREGYHQIKEYSNIVREPKIKKELDEFNYLYQDHENRVYDINSVLEHAKENRKDIDEREAKRKLKNTNYNILASLNPEELEKYRKEKQTRNKPDEHELRGLIDTITSKTLAGEISKETGVDLLSDLMATSAMDKVDPNTELKELVDKSTSDVDASKDILDKESMKKVEELKKETVPENDAIKDMDKSFYTKSMDLSDKDFFTDDDEVEKKIPIVVKILLILILLALLGVAAYLVYKNL